MKKYLILVFLFAFSTNIFAQKVLLNKVVATVGGEIVLLSDIEEQYNYLKENQQNLPNNARCSITESILLNNLMLNQSKLDSIKVTDDDVETQLNTRFDQIMRLMDNDMSKFESYYRQTMPEMKTQVREDLKNKLLVDKMRAKISEDLKITPSDVKLFFEKIPRDSLPYFNSEVELDEIVYVPKVNAEQKKIAYDKLMDIRKRIVDKNENFATLAEKYSDDIGSGRAGGDLGWAKRGSYVVAFEAAAYRLEPDEISPIVESEFGYHLIQLMERRGNSIHARHILIKPEITDQDLKNAELKLDSVRTLIKQDSLTFSKAVKLYSDKNTQSYNNDGRMHNPHSGNNIFEVADLDPEVYFAIDTIKIGEMTKPLPFRTPAGETNYRLVRLKSRTNPHRANLKQDYSKIYTAALESRRNEFTTEWFKKRINATFISIDPAYLKECPNLETWNTAQLAKNEK